MPVRVAVQVGVLRACVWPCAVTLLLAGCVEFGDPVIPERQTPAVLAINVRTFDTGALVVDGTLSPGRDASGFVRVVQIPFIGVDGRSIEPDSVDERGVRRYQVTFPAAPDATAGPFDIVLPDVRGVGPLPAVRLYGLRRVGPDTLRLAAHSDIVLHVDTVAAAPLTPFRQWFIDVRSAGTSFRISADRAPPASLRIPSEFVAASGGGRADVSLIYFQTVQVRAASGMYVGNVVLDTRLNWVVLYEPAP
jgi:hypothetical protein